MIPANAGANRAQAAAVSDADSSSATGAAANATVAPTIVKMSDDAPMYQPPSLQISTGQTVEWENTGQVSHSVTDDPNRASNPIDALLPQGVKPFNSGNVMPGGTYRHTFTEPGRYRYFCMNHEVDRMVGEIIVLATASRRRLAASRRAQPARPQLHVAHLVRKILRPTSPRATANFNSQPWRNTDGISSSLH